MGMCYGFGSAFTGFVCKMFSRVVVMQVGIVLMGISSLFVGPSILLGMPDVVYLIYIGICLNAFFGPMMQVPVVPELISSVTIEQRTLIAQECEGEQEWDNKQLRFEKVKRRV